MPKLWTETIEAHRQEVRRAILDTTWALVSEQGPASVTMTQVAEKAGIGRATLYKYFPDVEAILLAWHERQVAVHFDLLTAARDRASDAAQRLETVLEAYARIMSHRREHGTDLLASLHRGEHIVRVQRQLGDLFRDVLAEAAAAGHVREDVPPEELASYCQHALASARDAPAQDAVGRLVAVVLAGIRPN